jgi:oxaloacetate decarboxylase alpha subunit
MLPIADKLEKAGYWSLEMWGGATFDSCIRFLNEDPWERVRSLKKMIPTTPFQMLLRGQNIVGYRHYADDVVVKFVELAAEAGIDIFRIFDALNDLRNLKTAMEAVKKLGKHAEGTISYTVSPVHSVKMFVEMAVELEKMGSDTICVKDMAGLLAPEVAYELIGEIKSKVKVPIHLHSHCTSGFANMTYLVAIDAGVDILDCSISTLSQGTSHPPTETIVAMLQGTEHDTGMDLDNLINIGNYFGIVRKKYKKFESSFTGVDVNILKSQIPGGMISNLESQLKQQNALDRLDDVLEEVPKVRKDLGYPPLVTPTSQIVGTQAVLNVIMGERYKMVSKESQDLLEGRYGKLPAPVDKELRKKVSKGKEQITCRPADLLKPEWEKFKKELPGKSDEDIMVHALFPQVSEQYFKKRGMPTPELFEPDDDKVAAAPRAAQGAPASYTVTVDGKSYNVVVAEGTVAGAPTVTIPAPQQAAPQPQPELKPAAPAASETEGTPLVAPLPGTIIRIEKDEGSSVSEGDVILIMEAMKMENEITSPASGTVAQILVSVGEQVHTGQHLAIIGV